jgi:MoaA/NifB/PqqE/SkfB family radical SAM enzyme
MTRDVIFHFLDDAADIGVKAISFVSDGESTCSPHLYDAILYGKQNGLDMALGTNGYLLRKDCLEEVLPALTYLRFNMSAADARAYSHIHGCPEHCFDTVCDVIETCVRLKKEKSIEVTIGLQMVLMPEFSDQILPLSRLGRRLGVDYLIIKHCSDDENGSLGVDYNGYGRLVDVLKQAETHATDSYLIKAKWSKLMSGGKRKYTRCYGPPFITQFSGSGLVAPCGMLFNRKYKRFHIGNIAETSYKKIWQSDRYWQVMNAIASSRFNAQTQCGTLCLQHSVNEFLWDLKRGVASQLKAAGAKPLHANFV